VITSVLFVLVHDQQTNDAWAAGSRAAAPSGAAGPRLAVVLKTASVAGGTAVNGTITLLDPARPAAPSSQC
jgi:hypothetical protein